MPHCSDYELSSGVGLAGMAPLEPSRCGMSSRVTLDTASHSIASVSDNVQGNLGASGPGLPIMAGSFPAGAACGETGLQPSSAGQPELAKRRPGRLPTPHAERGGMHHITRCSDGRWKAQLRSKSKMEAWLETYTFLLQILETTKLTIWCSAHHVGSNSFVPEAQFPYAYPTLCCVCTHDHPNGQTSEQGFNGTITEHTGT
eukprot:360049-Chlamydomonas_euryale.AAC.3